MPEPDKETTEVTTWLKKNGAEQFVDEFYEEGYYDLDDVSDEAITRLVEKKGIAARLIRALKKPEPPPKPPPMRDPLVPKETTEVTMWLKKNGAEQFVDKFYNMGYDNLADVSEGVIKELVDLPGIAARLIRALPKPEPKPMRDPLAVPSLPEGTTLDLSLPELTAPDGIKFELPLALSTEVSEGAIKSPNSLKNADWLVIARDSQMLYGFQMDGVTPKKAQRPVLFWKVPKTTDFVRAEHLEAKVTSELSYTEQSASYAKSGFNSQSATAGFPFASASFERSQREKQAGSSYYKLLYLTGIWRYPRATVFLEKCTTVSPSFKNSIHQALESADPATALDKVFEEFGHAIPSEVLLGGQLYFQEKREAHGSIEQNEVESTIKAAVSVKLENTPVGNTTGSAGASFQDGSAQKVTAHEIANRVSFEAFGGDTTLASNPARWAGTVKDPNLWAVIANDRLHSTIDLLDDVLRERVLAVWNKIPSAQIALDGRVVTIRTPALNPPLRVLGVNAGHTATPHPTRLPDRVLSNPEGQGIAWRLRFSGQYGDKATRSNPLFWIELVGQNALLAFTPSIHVDVFADVAEREPLASTLRQTLSTKTWNGAFAALASANVEQLPRPTEDASARRALWYVKPVDPAHYFGNAFTDAYFLEQFESHQVLSSQDDASGAIPFAAVLASAFPGFPFAPEFVEAFSGIHANANEFSLLVDRNDMTDDKRKLASSCWVLKPFEETGRV